MAGDEVDLENRDPNELNSHVKVAFDEIFGEPEGAHSIDCVWKCSYKCFNGTLGICYKILTAICAIPYAFCWACNFACMAFYHIWYCTPYVRALSMDLLAFRKIYAICLDTLCSPIFEACGSCFSRIVVTNKS